MAATNKRNIGETIWSVLTVLVGVIILMGIYLSIMGAPDAMNLPTETERRVQHVFYFHVASGWVGFFAFLLVTGDRQHSVPDYQEATLGSSRAVVGRDRRGFHHR